MAHGRKRSFIGGVVAGMVLTIGMLAALVYVLDITFGPPGYPHFTEISARGAVLAWARVNPFPKEAESFCITTQGTMFSREFSVSFFGEPEAMNAWVKSCPGIADPKTKKMVAGDGSITYQIPAGEGAAYAVLVHHPVRGTVKIRTYWS